jgi:hypothetical protein
MIGPTVRSAVSLRNVKLGNTGPSLQPKRIITSEREWEWGTTEIGLRPEM